MAEITEDHDVKREFDLQMLAFTNGIGQLSLPKRISPFFLVMDVPFVAYT